MSELNIDFWL